LGWALVLLAGALAFWGHRPFPGAVFLCLVAGYGFGRFWLEWTRAERDEASGVAVHAAISVVLVAIAVCGLALARP
jgi:prolipoprotein diacylglyceryltransferase